MVLKATAIQEKPFEWRLTEVEFQTKMGHSNPTNARQPYCEWSKGYVALKALVFTHQKL
jgi:hypothetical protein